MEYTISSFFRDLSAIRQQTFQPYTIKNSFHESGMFPVSYKIALKKMRHYNKGNLAGTQPGPSNTAGQASETYDTPSVDEDGELDLPTLTSSYFECQKGIGEWIEHAETFSPTSRARFQQWAKGTQISLAQAELQQQSYHDVQARILEEARRKSKSRRVIQKGGVVTNRD